MRDTGGRGRIAAAAGTCAALGALLAGCGGVEEVSGTPTIQSTAPGADGFTTAEREVRAMVKTAHAGSAPVYCELSDNASDGSIWLRGENRYKMTISKDGADAGMIREDSMLWIWNESRNEGLMMTDNDGDLSELDSRALFDETLYDEDIGCRLEDQDTKYAPPADVTFYTIADVTSGKFSEADAQALLSSFDSFGN